MSETDPVLCCESLWHQLFYSISLSLLLKIPRFLSLTLHNFFVTSPTVSLFVVTSYTVCAAFLLPPPLANSSVHAHPSVCRCIPSISILSILSDQTEMNFSTSSFLSSTLFFPTTCIASYLSIPSVFSFLGPMTLITLSLQFLRFIFPTDYLFVVENTVWRMLIFMYV